jgi:hypothetical protein
MKTAEDFEFYNPRCNCGGTVRAGTEVVLIKQLGWSAYVVKHHTDVAHFMNAWDFSRSYVVVPANIAVVD